MFEDKFFAFEDDFFENDGSWDEGGFEEDEFDSGPAVNIDGTLMLDEVIDINGNPYGVVDDDC